MRDFDEDKYVDVQGTVLAIGNDAVLVDIEVADGVTQVDTEVWIPHSQLEHGDEGYSKGEVVELSVTLWLLGREGLI